MYNTNHFKPIIPITYILLLITLIISCNNDDDEPTPTPEQQLPPITQTGANTFGCLIDGNLFIPRNGSGTFNATDPGGIVWVNGNYPNYLFHELDMNDYKSEHTKSLLIHIQNLSQLQVNSYTINESNGFKGIDGPSHTHMFCRIWRENISNYQWYLSYENSGSIEVSRYDSSLNIMSGTFNGKVRNFYEPHDTIEITNGRFDVNSTNLDLVIFP